ncbi:MAG: M1 family peptidase [Flavobacterium sp.]|nr:MAG: M1 family peptidase [Flavobacterium sp.]
MKFNKSCFFLLFLSCLLSAQQTRNVDFKTIDAELTINPAEKQVAGNVSAEFEILSKTDTVYIDAVNMTFTDVKVNGQSIAPKYSNKAIKLYGKLKKGKNTVSFNYIAKPKQTMYFVGEGENFQIWTQGQGKNTSHWLPSFDDVNEKVVFGLTVSYDPAYQVISNGILKERKTEGGMTRWQYKMQQPMSSYLVMLAIGKFAERTEHSSSGIPLEQYVSTSDKDKIEPTYRHSAQIFDFLEKEIGVPYPWEIYRQIPANDFLYGGMENTSSTIFAHDYVVDAVGFNDRNYVNVNAHELAHQWFGDMVTAKTGKHHWLQEGFATYYALLAEREVFGDDYFYAKLYDMAEELKQAESSDSIPILNEKASSLSFYKKGAWALHVLRENIGEENFRKAVKSYLEKHAFQNVETEDFFAEVRKVSNYDLNAFSKRWLESGKFETSEALDLLKKNKSMQMLFDLDAFMSSEKDMQKRNQEMLRIMRSDADFTVKQDVLYQTASLPFEQKQEVIRAALATGNVKVRQAVAQTIGKFPESFYGEFSTLLDDQSYITQELATAIIWKLFPDKHKELLERTDGRIGLNDKNLRIQWLTLALTEKDFHPSEKVRYYDELLDYGTPKYESTIRQNALESLIFIGPNDKNAMKLLVNPLVHHKWQFQKFAREKIRALVKFIAPRVFYEKLLPELPENERIQLQKLISESQH